MEPETADILSDFNKAIPVETSGNLWNITRWSRFVAIGGFLLIGFLSLCLVAAYLQEHSFQRYRLFGNSGTGLLILLSGALVTVVLLIFLLRFALYVFFEWVGGFELGQPHYYRIQNTAFVLEYDNTQNNANHVHCIWRDFANDFGGDVLKRHASEAHGK